MKKMILVMGIAMLMCPALGKADAGYAFQFDGVDDVVIIPNAFSIY